MAWHIDQAHTRIGFSVKHLLVATARGEFKRYRGVLGIDREDFTRSNVEGDVDLDSIDTGNAERDGMLRRSEVLSDAQHPKLTFRSTGIERRAASEYVVRGLLALRGVERPITCR